MTIQPGNVVLSAVRGSGYGLSTFLLSASSRFIVTLKDQHGNPTSRNKPDLKVQVSPAPLSVSVQDLNNGVYQIVWVANSTSPYMISVNASSQHITDSPFTATSPTSADVKAVSQDDYFLEF